MPWVLTSHMTTTAKRQTVTNIIDGLWVEITRREEAIEFGWLQDLRDWEREQFADWYAKHREHWDVPNQYKPFDHVGNAYNAWLRRP